MDTRSCRDKLCRHPFPFHLLLIVCATNCIMLLSGPIACGPGWGAPAGFIAQVGADSKGDTVDERDGRASSRVEDVRSDGAQERVEEHRWGRIP